MNQWKRKNSSLDPPQPRKINEQFKCPSETGARFFSGLKIPPQKEGRNLTGSRRRQTWMKLLSHPRIRKNGAEGSVFPVSENRLNGPRKRSAKKWKVTWRMANTCGSIKEATQEDGGRENPVCYRLTHPMLMLHPEAWRFIWTRSRCHLHTNPVALVSNCAKPINFFSNGQLDKFKQVDS